MTTITRSIPAIHGGTPIRTSFLDFSRPVITDDEKKAVMSVLDSGWLTTGAKSREFEQHFCDYIGVQYALAVNSCTAGLFLILKGMGVGPGDQVITTPNTFAATVNVIEHLGATPVFCDIDFETGNINPWLISRKINDKTKAIIAVHYAGKPCEMNQLTSVSRQYNIPIIGDCAHAVETTWENRKIGSYGFASAFSFYATKNLTTGEGGMIVTNDEELFRMMKVLRLHGLSDDAESRYLKDGKSGYDLIAPGYKFNMPDILAALGIVQLKNIERNHKIRKFIYSCYCNKLQGLEHITLLDNSDYDNNAFHLLPILIDFEKLSCTKDEFTVAMKLENIGVSAHFNPVHLYSYYKEKYSYKNGDYPISERFGEKVITLPFNQHITEKDIEDVVLALTKVIGYYSARAQE